MGHFSVVFVKTKIFYGPFNFCMGHLHRITKLYVSNGPWPLPFPITGDRTCLVEEWAFVETVLKHFSRFRLLLRKTRLSYLNFFYSNKFGFASNLWACLSANITLHN
jgi:hypothetical protein